MCCPSGPEQGLGKAQGLKLARNPLRKPPELPGHLSQGGAAGAPASARGCGVSSLQPTLALGALVLHRARSEVAAAPGVSLANAQAGEGHWGSAIIVPCRETQALPASLGRTAPQDSVASLGTVGFPARW